MANGQHIAKQNFAAFIAWSVSKTDDDFRKYVHKCKLKRSEIASECRFARSVLIQNPAIKNALETLEQRLRTVGVLPTSEPVLKARTQTPTIHDREPSNRQHDSKRLSRLEQENAALRAELSEAKRMLERFKLMSEFMAETGRMPR
ncbi:hypothetical protein EQV97_27295 [Pseudomonas sp. TMW22090]|uniref:VPA1267 family protein n=1 Tax=Pseudomonas sp. TMW22090 TaxID=2506434 RepID=UPI001F1161F3|nr:VPA1267 family protein [Pseudomonas sp. TMW22090]MCH4881047.1 hypothetical protein [Pseudomonas sp. TMW22090]